MYKYFNIFFISILICCDPIDDKMKLVNNSNERIFIVKSHDTIFTRKPIVLNEDGDTMFTHMSSLNELDSSSFPKLIKWETLIREKSVDGKYRFFIFKESFLKDKNLDTILKKQLYSSKLEYTLDEFKSMNWRVVYE